MTADSLWGDLKELKTIKTPALMMREQAEILTQSTNGVLVGKVEGINSRWRGGIAHELVIRVPSLNDYELSVLRIEHPVHIYPVYLFEAPYGKVEAENVMDEVKLLDLLKTALSHPDLRAILGALLSQAQG